MLAEQNFKNVFICSYKYQDRINRLTQSTWPEWLKGCQILFSPWCHENEGNHFDHEGTRSPIPISVIERILPHYDTPDREDDE